MGAGMSNDAYVEAAGLLARGERGKAVEVIRRALGEPCSPDAEGRFRYLLGVCLLEMDKGAEAAAELGQACGILEKAAPSGVARALAVTALARAQLACDKAEQSVETGRKALALLKACLPADDPRMAPSLFSLSFGEYVTRNFDGAEDLVRDAMGIWTRTKGPECPEVTTCLNNLGRIYEEKGLMDEGIAWHKKALDIRIRTLGDHNETAFSMGNLGVALASAGRWTEARDMLENAIACYARCGRTTGSDIDGYRYNLGICNKALAGEQ